MIKPIFIITIAGLITKDEMDSYRNCISDYMEGYYVIISHNSILTENKFECFYEKDFNEVKFEELKNLVNNKE
jgi:hypothetical protein